MNKSISHTKLYKDDDEHKKQIKSYEKRHNGWWPKNAINDLKEIYNTESICSKNVVDVKKNKKIWQQKYKTVQLNLREQTQRENKRKYKWM